MHPLIIIHKVKFYYSIGDCTLIKEVDNLSPEIASKKDSERNGRNDTRRSLKCTSASILIVLAMICSAVAVVGFSDSSDATSEGDEDPNDPINGGTHWAISGDTLTISKTTGSGKVGCYASDYPRTPWQGFRGTTLIIEEGVTEIGTYAFYDLDGLTSVTLPNSLTTIKNSAFSNCDSLESITIPDNVELRSEVFER